MVVMPYELPEEPLPPVKLAPRYPVTPKGSAYVGGTPDANLSESKLEDIEQERSVFVACGTVRYVDIFGREGSPDPVGRSLTGSLTDDGKPGWRGRRDKPDSAPLRGIP